MLGYSKVNIKHTHTHTHTHTHSWTHLQGVCVDQVGVLGQGGCEGVVGRLQRPWFSFLGQEEREVHDPQEVERCSVPQGNAPGLQELSALQPQFTQQGALEGERERESERARERQS